MQYRNLWGGNGKPFADNRRARLRLKRARRFVKNARVAFSVAVRLIREMPR